MDIAVVKQADGRHRAVVTTDDGTVQFAVADYGTHLPHDLVHYAVERALGMRYGFWGLIAAGARFDSVAAFGARRPRRLAAVDDPLVAAHAAELGEAERVANAVSRPGAEAGLAAGMRAVMDAELARLTTEWHALGVGGVLRLRWP